jgi:hypothetical protein
MSERIDLATIESIGMRNHTAEIQESAKGIELIDKEDGQALQEETKVNLIPEVTLCTLQQERV